MNTRAPLLQVTGLSVGFRAKGTTTKLVEDASISVDKSETVGVVGESGCGKSTLLRAVAGVLPRGIAPIAGEILVGGRVIDQRRGSGDIAMIFQDPMTGLNPVMTVEHHITEVPRKRDGLGKSEARDLALHLLREVGIDDAERRLGFYPHQLSGGLRQRVLIAAALSSKPKVLLCDEPTTALDVTVQARFIGLLRSIVADRGIGILYVTHDLPLLGTMCDRINVMYAGQIIERGTRDEVLRRSAHPYTAALLAAAPRINSRTPSLASIPGHPPALTDPPPGCRFAARCEHALPMCRAVRGLGSSASGHDSACVRSVDLMPRIRRGEA